MVSRDSHGSARATGYQRFMVHSVVLTPRFLRERDQQEFHWPYPQAGETENRGEGALITDCEIETTAGV